MTVRLLRVILLGIVVSAITTGCQSKSNKAAHALLESYMDNITGAAGNAAAMAKAMDAQEGQVDALKGEVPEAFITRYHRLLATTRLAIAQSRDDNTRKQIAGFVQSVTGAAPPVEDKQLTAAAAGAFSEEVLLLDMMLDGETNRNKVKQKYADRIRSRRKA